MAGKNQLNNKIIDLILHLSRSVRSGMSFDTGSKHLTVYQLQILIYIAKQKKVRMVDLAQNFNITKPTATVLINNLVEKGYLKRAIGEEDKREVKISLAKKGLKLLEQAAKYRSAKINHILSYISDQDKKCLEKILQTIAEKVKTEYGK